MKSSYISNPLNKILLRSSILLLLAFLMFNGCSSTEEQPNASFLEKELYDISQTRIKNGNFSSAITSLETLEARFPFGRYAEQAQAELIYAYYRNFEFEAARSSAERFINLHPRHAHTGYAYYLRGLSAFTDDSGIFTRYFESDLSRRDIEPAQRSFENLSEFVSRYPDSPYVVHAKQRMIYLKNILAKHEVYVADFYMKRKAYIAAIGRAKYVIEHMPKTPQIPQALSILVKAYNLLGYEELSKKNLEILKLNYPNFNSQELLKAKRSWTNRLTFGLLGEEEIPLPTIED